MTRDRTCKERVEGQMQDRDEDIAALYELVDHGSVNGTGEDYDEAVERLDNFLLSIDQTIHIKMLMSWGGPSDYIEVIVNRLSATPSDYEILEAWYHFEDWFDGAERRISEDSALWRYLTDTIESYMEAH